MPEGLQQAEFYFRYVRTSAAISDVLQIIQDGRRIPAPGFRITFHLTHGMFTARRSQRCCRPASRSSRSAPSRATSATARFASASRRCFDSLEIGSRRRRGGEAASEGRGRGAPRRRKEGRVAGVEGGVEEGGGDGHVYWRI